MRMCWRCERHFLDRSTNPASPSNFCSRKCSRKYHNEIRKSKAGKITDGMRNAVYRRDKLVCQICKRPCHLTWSNDPLAPSIDHIVPISHGGKSVLENLQTAHRRCNSSKHGLDSNTRD